MSLFDFLKQIQSSGSAMLSRGALNFTTGFTVTDDQANNRINVAATGGAASAFLTSLNAAPGADLTDAPETLLLSQGFARYLRANTYTASRTKTLGTGGGEVAGSQIAITVFFQSGGWATTVTNGGVGGGSWTISANSFGTYVFEFDGTNWYQRSIAGQYAVASTTTSGLMSSADKTFVSAINTGAGAVVSPSSLRATAATMPIQDSTGAAALTCTLASGGACSVTWAAGVNGITYGQTQHASAAGNPTTYGGQQGANGFVGADVFVKSGLGGVPGTQLAGKVRIDTGALVGGAGAPIAFESNGSAYGQIVNDAFGFHIQSASTTVALDSLLNINFLAHNNIFQWFGVSGSLARSDTFNPGGACSIAWQAGVTSLAETLPSGVGKVSTFAFSENSGQRNSPFQSAGATTGTLTPNWNSGENFQETTTSTGAITIANGTNPRDGAVYTVVVVTGAFAVTFGAAYKGPNAGAPTASVNSKTNQWSFKYNSTLGQYIQQSNVSY